MKKVKILTIILFIVLVTMVAFFGVFGQVQNRMENKVKQYSYDMDLTGGREVVLKVDESKKEIIKDKDGKIIDNATDEEIEKNGYVKEEEPANKEEILTADNYKKVKRILDNRLRKMEVENYIVRLNEKKEKIVVEIPENDDTASITSILTEMGKFEITDSENNEVFLTNDDISDVKVMYNTAQNGTSVYLQIEFKNEGSKKLKEISTNYKKVENPTQENSESEDAEKTDLEASNEKEKKIAIKMDDEAVVTTSFESPIENGMIQLSIGNATTDAETLNGYVKNAKAIATVLNEEKSPIKYQVETNQYVESDVKLEDLKNVGIAVLVIVIVALVLLIVKYRKKGIMSAILYVGVASILLLVVKYTNLKISIGSMCGIIVTMILNYILTFNLLSNIEKNKEINKVKNKTIGDFFIRIIPICILTICFSFMPMMTISGFGLVMFWGLVIIAIYNILITKNVLKIMEEK